MSKFTMSQRVIIGMWGVIIGGVAFGTMLGKIMVYVNETFGSGTGLFVPIGLGFLVLCIYSYKNWGK